MNKFTTTQLQQALVTLHASNDSESNAAYELTFDELHSRMGDDAFDSFLDNNGL